MTFDTGSDSGDRARTIEIDGGTWRVEMGSGAFFVPEGDAPPWAPVLTFESVSDLPDVRRYNFAEPTTRQLQDFSTEELLAFFKQARRP